MMRARVTFSVERYCGWCKARWVYNEMLPADDRIYHCPNCEAPDSKFEHPEYGLVAMVDWALSRDKSIPKDLLLEYLKVKGK
jgi:hypothetical protein